MGNNKFIAAFNSMASSLGKIAASHDTDFFANYNEIAELAAQGLASKIFGIGDTITAKWKDPDAKDKEYDNPWRVNHFSEEEDKLGRSLPGMWIQTKYAWPFGVQFSHSRAFLVITDGTLPAGTYHIKLGTSWGKNAVKDKVYQFALPELVKGKMVTGFYNLPDTPPSEWKAYVYEEDGISHGDAIVITEGSEGTDLGTLNYTTRQEGLTGSGFTYNLNSMQEAGYGLNDWDISAIRQYMNSKEGPGLWWKKQDLYDIAPNELMSHSGMLAGFSDEFLNMLVPIKTVTYKNTVMGEREPSVTYDKFILPSFTQMYCQEYSTEGEPQEYWKLLNGTPDRFKWGNRGSVYPILKQYGVDNISSPQYFRGRSANRDLAYGTFYVGTSGFIDHWFAASASLRFEPLAFVSKEI